LQWLSQFLSGLATCVGYAWLSGDQPRRLLFTWPSRGVSAPAGSAGHARALVVLPHLLPPSSGFQLSGFRPWVPLLPPFLSSLLLATWGFSERGPISQTVVFQGGFFCLGRSFPFPSLIGFFPSYCQALAEDRVTTPTKKKKKKSSVDKFSSKVHGVHMELGGKLFNSLRIETQPVP